MVHEAYVSGWFDVVCSAVWARPDGTYTRWLRRSRPELLLPNTMYAGVLWKRLLFLQVLRAICRAKCRQLPVIR
jgi:hypothetical protein